MNRPARWRGQIAALTVTAITVGALAAVGSGQSAFAAPEGGSQNGNTAASDASDGGVSEAEPVVDPSAWASQYPNEYSTYIKSIHATYAHDAASGKPNSLLDVEVPPDGYPAPFMTGCLSCHSSEYNQLRDQLGDDLFNVDADETRTLVHEGITCYSCHGNTPGVMNPQNDWVIEAAEKGGIQTSDENKVCMQCHSWGDFTQQFSNPDSSTWSFLQVGVDPDDLWEYLSSEGNETPTVPTAEIVFNNYYGSTHDQMGVNCVDCHMQKAVDDDGNSYTVHMWQSAGTNEELFENCASCHGDTVEDRKEALESVQEKFLASRDAAQAEIDAFSEELQTAIDAKTISDEDAATATTLLNKATFYVSYESEQGNGIHNLGKDWEGAFQTATDAIAEGRALIG